PTSACYPYTTLFRSVNATSDKERSCTDAANNKIWLKEYPPSVPAVIDISKSGSISDMIGASCRKFADSPAFYCMGKNLSYRELDTHSRVLAGWLQSRGLVKGDRVAIMLPNILHYPVAIYAILRAGLVVVNVNRLYTAPELEQ